MGGRRCAATPVRRNAATRATGEWSAVKRSAAVTAWRWRAAAATRDGSREQRESLRDSPERLPSLRDSLETRILALATHLLLKRRLHRADDHPAVGEVVRGHGEREVQGRAVAGGGLVREASRDVQHVPRLQSEVFQ